MTSSRRNTDPEIDDAQLAALVQLRLLPNLRDERLFQLLSRYDPKSLIESASPELLGERAFAALASPVHRDRVARAVAMIHELNVGVVWLRAARYPERLRPLGELAPPVLFLRGARPEADLLV